MSDKESDNATRSIEVSPETYQRFEEYRSETETWGHTPRMGKSAYLEALLDTEQAVREGYYDGE